MNFDMSSGTISMNGVVITMRGQSLYVNGVLYGPVAGGGTPGEAPPSLDIGDRTLTLDKDGRIVGDIHGDLKVFGNVSTLIIEGKVGGSVQCSGSLRCEHVEGSVNAGGNITCERVGGSVTAGGNVLR